MDSEHTAGKLAKGIEGMQLSMGPGSQGRLSPRARTSPAEPAGLISTIALAEYLRDDFSEIFEARYRDANQPLIIRGAGLTWPACEKWDLDYITAACGAAYANAMTFDGTRPKIFKIAVAAAIARMRQGEPLYLSQATLCEDPDADPTTGMLRARRAELPQLMVDCSVPAFLANKRTKSWQAFIGQDTFAPMHFHPGDPGAGLCNESIKVQIHGRKQVVLFAPDADLQAFRVSGFNFSKIPFRDWFTSRERVLAACPWLQHVTAYEAILEPGDMLFIPAYWWHSFFGIGPSMSVTCFWCDAEPRADGCLLESRNYRNTARRAAGQRAWEALTRHMATSVHTMRRQLHRVARGNLMQR